MKLLLALIFFSSFASLATAQTGVLDLTSLQNDAGQTVPTYIPRNNMPPGNVITDIGATLGRVLFYDKRLSRNDTVACASCHKQETGFSDTATASAGVSGTTGRHSMRLINSRFAAEGKFFWDERAINLETQTSQPIQDHVEMGFSGSSGDPVFADLVVKLAAIPEYRVLFTMAFGNSTITEGRLQRALAQFVRSIQSFDSKYDIGRAQVAADADPFPNYTNQENNGKSLYLRAPPQGGAGGAGCHRPPEFDIDPNSLNNGVIAAIGGGTDLTNTRSPSLRDLVNPAGLLNGPLMHDGSFTSLAQVIIHYAAIPADNTNLDNLLRRPGGAVQTLNLTTQQRNDIAAFLRTLTGTAVYTDSRWSNPFDTSNNLDVIILPTASQTLSQNGNGTVTITNQAAPGLSYQFETSNNLQTWSPVTTVIADTNGLIQQTVAIVPGTFYRFSYTP